MDEETKALAVKYMERAVREDPCPPRFPFSLPESRERMCGLLLGSYGACVERRGMDFQMDDATVSKVERVVRWMYESRKTGLLLCGTLGNGKTTMLRAVSSVLGVHSDYMEAQTVYEWYRRNQSLPAVSGRRVLLLDDLGVEPSSYNDFGEVRYPLAELLLQRYRLNAPTLIATNLTFDQIGAIYGDRLQDRMREMYAVITYTEISYRK